MKRIILYLAALAAIAAIFTGCTATGNVSDNPDGMVESSTTRATTPTTTAQPSTTVTESNIISSILDDDLFPGESSSDRETHVTEESTTPTRTRKTPR